MLQRPSPSSSRYKAVFSLAVIACNASRPAVTPQLSHGVCYESVTACVLGRCLLLLRSRLAVLVIAYSFCFEDVVGCLVTLGNMLG